MVVVTQQGWFPSIVLRCLFSQSHETSILVVPVIYTEACIPACIPNRVPRTQQSGKKTSTPVSTGQ
jgi:hypothetical protein